MEKLSNLDQLALSIIDNIDKNESSKLWNFKSKFYNYRKLEIDKRGSFGERFILACLTSQGLSRRIEYKDGEQGYWDFKINNKKFEVKTSSLDINHKFQNEGLKANLDLEGIIFLGVAPNDLYLKCVRYKDIDFSTLHNRLKSKTGSGYKWDHTVNQMTKLVKTKDVWTILNEVFLLE